MKYAKNRLKKTSSVLAKKISRRMLTIFVGIYILMLFFLFLLVTPQLYKSADARAFNTLISVADEYVNARGQTQNYMNALCFNQTLLEQMSEYETAPSEKSYAEIKLGLSAFVSGNEQLLAAAMEDSSHTYISSIYFKDIVTPEILENDKRYQSLFKYQTGNYFTYLSPKEFYAIDTQPSYDLSYHVLVYCQKVEFLRHPFVVTAYSNLNNVVSRCYNLSEGILSDYAILDRDGNVIYPVDAPLKQMEEKYLVPKNFLSYKGSFKSAFGVYYYTKDLTSGWTFVGFSPYSMMLSTLLIVFLIITMIYIISFIIYVIILTPATTRMLSPLTKLHDSMKDYTVGEEIYLNLRTHDEIEELGKIYTEMLQRINRQIEEIKNEEQMNAIVSYKLLATQVDPHFIYNTMNIINIMARQGNDEAIIEINKALIKILRERVNSKLTIFDTIEQELDTLYQYLLIMDYRYENKVAVHVNADMTLSENMIPKNIIQPLVENAFYHGFREEKFLEKGMIDVNIYLVEQEIVIEVSDNGEGLEKERLAMLLNHPYDIYLDHKPHIGIDNIKQRLDYVYHGNYEFNIQSAKGFGTTISISIPMEIPKDSRMLY